jgi:uncharacterized membrane protein
VTNAVLLGHLVGAFLFVSGAVVAALALEAARRRTDPAEIAVVLGLARAGAAIVGIGWALVLVFGLWLVHLGRFGYGAGWVDAALALFVAAAVLGGLGGRAPRQARERAETLAAEGRPGDAELRVLLDDRRALLANYAAAVLVLAILVLMIWKPGAAAG